MSNNFNYFPIYLFQRMHEKSGSSNLAVVDVEGKNSIWFAKQDVDVVSVDYS